MSLRTQVRNAVINSETELFFAKILPDVFKFLQCGDAVKLP